MGLFSIFRNSKRVYFPGCSTYFKHKEYFELNCRVLDRLGIDYKILNKKICCGLPALELGYDNEARKIARRNFEILKEEGIGEIITADGGCHKMFSQDYNNLIPDWNVKVNSFWALVLERLELKPGLIKNQVMEQVSFQDSCYLGRYFNIYSEPRKIIKMLGYEIIEMLDSRENSICCGSCGQLPFTNPELADRIARERILQAKRMNVKKLITCDIRDYEILKKNAGNDLEVIDLIEVLANALGIKKKVSETEKVEEEILDKIDKDLENQEIEELVGGKDE